MHALESSLTPLRFAFVLVVLAAACGRGPAPADNPSELSVDTLAAVDSIGIMMGDSNYMLGAIADFTPLPGGGAAILDRITEKVSVFDSEGVFVSSFGGHGEAPGKFQWPVRVDVLPSGDMLVIEGVTGKVNVFDPEGALLTSWQMEGMGIYPLDARPFDDSSFVSYNFSMLMDETVLKIRFSLWRYHALTGEVLARYMTWEEPATASTDFTDAYLVVATDCVDRLFLSRASSPSWMIEVLDGAATPLDTLLLFPDRPRLAVESDSGYVPGTVTVSFMYQEGEGGDMASGFTNSPTFHPFVSDIETGPGGELWVRQGGLPPTEWDVISPGGEPTGRFHMAAGDSTSMILLEADADGAYAMDANTEDYHRLYRMELR